MRLRRLLLSSGRSGVGHRGEATRFPEAVAVRRGTIGIFAAPDDDRALRAYAASIGLTLLHPHAHRMTLAENERAFADDPVQGGLFSFLPAARLTPHPHPRIGLNEATGPLIRYIRPSYQPPYLVAGQVRWFPEITAFAAETRPYFGKLSRWVRTRWRKREEDGYFVGPAADVLLATEPVQVLYLPPGVNVVQKPVRG